MLFYGHLHETQFRWPQVYQIQKTNNSGNESKTVRYVVFAIQTHVHVSTGSAALDVVAGYVHSYN